MKRKITEDEYRRRLEDDHRRLQDMRRRWPKIAEAADHPMTAVLAARRRSNSANWVIVVAILIGLIGSKYFGKDFMLPYIIVGNLIGSFMMRAVWTKRGRLGDGLSDSFGKKRGKYLVDLWLTPLSYRQLLGIETGRTYLRDCRQSRFTTVILSLILSGLAVGYSEYTRFAPRWSFDNLAFTGGLAALAFSFIPLANDFTIQSALARLHGLLRTTHHWKLPNSNYTLPVIASGFLGLIMVLLFIAIVVGVAHVTSPFEIRFGYPHYGILLFATALGIVWYSRSSLPRATERRFESQAAQGEVWYKELAQMSAEDV